MIRNNDLHRFITSISTALAGPIMGDLQSDGVRRLSGVLLLLLDRIASDLADGNVIAADTLRQWEELESEVAAVGLAGAPAVAEEPGLVRETLDRRITAVQQQLCVPAAFDGLVSRLRGNDPGARAWMKKASGTVLQINQKFEDSFEAQGNRKVEVAVDRGAALRTGLAAYLKQRYPQLPDDPLEEFFVASGGFSKVTALFTLPENDVLPRRLALRLDIPNAITPAVLADEYPILEQVYRLGLPVPRPLLFEPDASHLGGAFVISTQVENAKVAGSPFHEDRKKGGTNIGPEFGREVARLLADLHRGTLETAPDPEIAKARDGIIAALTAEWRTMDKPPFSLGLDLGLAWLAANPLPLDRPVTLIHGDFAPHNVLTRDGHVAALLDWELAKRCDPAEDLAQAKMLMTRGIIDWDDFVATYIAAGGPAIACDPHAVAYYAIIIFLQHGVNETRLRNHYLRATRSDMEAMICASHFQDRLNLYQAKSLDEALALQK
jgi:aminoglycoside phosphotransferase (APT) family kinase protein